MLRVTHRIDSLINQMKLDVTSHKVKHNEIDNRIHSFAENQTCIGLVQHTRWPYRQRDNETYQIGWYKKPPNPRSVIVLWTNRHEKRIQIFSFQLFFNYRNL